MFLYVACFFRSGIAEPGNDGNGPDPASQLVSFLTCALELFK